MADDRKADPPKPYQASDLKAPPDGVKRELTDRQDSDRGRLAATLRSALEGKATTPAPAAEAKGSEQVRKSAPGMVLTPKGVAKTEIAREAHTAAMAKDNEPYKNLVDAVRKQCEIGKKDPDQVKSKGKDDHEK